MSNFKTPVKLSTLVGETITIHRLVWLNSKFGPYALVIRTTDDSEPAASTSNQVVLNQLREMKGFPVTAKVAEKTNGAGSRKYLVLEDIAQA